MEQLNLLSPEALKEIHTLDDLKQAFSRAGLAEESQEYPLAIPPLQPGDFLDDFRRRRTFESIRHPARPDTRQAFTSRLLTLLYGTLKRKIPSLALRESVLARRANGEETPPDSEFAYSNESVVPGHPVGSVMNIGLAGFILSQVENIMPDIEDPNFEAAFKKRGQSILDTLFFIDRLIAEYQEDIPALVLNIITLTRDRIQVEMRKKEVIGQDGAIEKVTLPETTFVPFSVLPFEGEDGRGEELAGRLQKVTSNVEAAERLQNLRAECKSLMDTLRHQLISRGLMEKTGYILHVFEWKTGIINCHPVMKFECLKGILTIIQELLRKEESSSQIRRLLTPFAEKIRLAKTSRELCQIIEEEAKSVLTDYKKHAIDSTLFTNPNIMPSEEVLQSPVDPFDQKFDERGFPAFYEVVARVYEAGCERLIAEEKARAETEARKPNPVTLPQVLPIVVLEEPEKRRELLERLRSLFVTRKGEVQEDLKGLLEAMTPALPEDVSHPSFQEALTHRVSGTIDILASLIRLRAAYRESDPARVTRGAKLLGSPMLLASGRVSPQAVPWGKRKETLGRRATFVDQDAKIPVVAEENDRLHEALLIQMGEHASLLEAVLDDGYYPNGERIFSQAQNPEFARVSLLNTLLKRISAFLTKAPNDIQKRFEKLRHDLKTAPDSKGFSDAISSFGRNSK